MNHHRPIEYVDHPLFAAADAPTRIEALRPETPGADQIDRGRGEADPLLYRALFARPILSRDEERYLFLRMNWCRYRAAHFRRLYPSGNEQQLAALVSESTMIRNRIAEANQRLVAAVSQPFADPLTPLDELVAAAQVPLLRAVELFDVSRGYCFSTYATHMIRNHCLRLRSRAVRRSRRESNVDAGRLEQSSAGPLPEAAEAARQSLIVRFFAELLDRERVILSARFGLGHYDRPHTFREIGRLVGLSKERTRVLAGRAIEKLQELANRQKLTWLEM